MTLAPTDVRVLRHASPFLVAMRGASQALDVAPFGIPTRWVLDPLDRAQAPFFFQLQRLDRLTFGPEGMPMARWVFFNMAELPGAIYGFAIEAAALAPEEREALEVPHGYEGPVPISMYIAIPTRRPGVWFGHNLASLNRLLPGRHLHGLGTLTKVLGLKAFRATEAMGATQWRSKALFIHARLGPLRLHTAWTPAHSIPQSLTYSWTIDEASLRALKEGRRPVVPHVTPTRWLDDDDEAGMQAVQARIEAGERWLIAGPPEPVADRARIPLSLVEAESFGSS